MTGGEVSRFREVGPQRAAEFGTKGYAQRHFFPHRIYYLPKGGPDGFKLARRMVGRCRPDQMVEAVLYATGPVLDEFPRDLFFDDDIIWHRQHFGKVGQVASANLLQRGPDLYSMVHISDLVQRISRRREHKTRVENRFEGWAHLLLNAVLTFAVERGARSLRLPTASLARIHTDPARHVQAELFDRIYDRTVQARLCVAREADWWVADVAANRDRLVTPDRREEPLEAERTICVSHDIERGFGHRKVAAEFAAFADAASPQHLTQMLAIEARHGVRATYNVLGLLLDEVRDDVRAHGHALGFHSYDHTVPSRWWRSLPGLLAGRRAVLSGAPNQLDRCRAVDYRIRGYRPPQSRLTAELTPANLCFHNFEWLASSAHSLQTRLPSLRNGIVSIPILFDDFDLYTGARSYPDWERRALERIEASDLTVLSLHDCYAHLWLAHYPRFLERLTALGRIRTLDEVADRMILTHAV